MEIAIGQSYAEARRTSSTPGLCNLNFLRLILGVALSPSLLSGVLLSLTSGEPERCLADGKETLSSLPCRHPFIGRFTISASTAPGAHLNELDERGRCFRTAARPKGAAAGAVIQHKDFFSGDWGSTDGDKGSWGFGSPSSAVTEHANVTSAGQGGFCSTRGAEPESLECGLLAACGSAEPRATAASGMRHGVSCTGGRGSLDEHLGGHGSAAGFLV